MPLFLANDRFAGLPWVMIALAGGIIVWAIGLGPKHNPTARGLLWGGIGVALSSLAYGVIQLH